MWTLFTRFLNWELRRDHVVYGIKAKSTTSPATITIVCTLLGSTLASYVRCATSVAQVAVC